MTLNVQLLTMLIMTVSGVYLGFATETFSRLTRTWRKSLLLKYALEISFWFAQTGLLFYVLVRVNEGIIRIHVFLACLLGYSIYVVLLRSVYRYVLEKIIHIVQVVFTKTVHAVYILLIQPVLWLILTLYTVVKGLFLFIIRCASYPLLWLMVLLKWLLPERFLIKASQVRHFCSTILIKCITFAKKIFLKWR